MVIGSLNSVCLVLRFLEDFVSQNSLEIDTEFETKESNFNLLETEIYEFLNFK